MAITRRRHLGAPDPGEQGDPAYQSLGARAAAYQRANAVANSGTTTGRQRIANFNALKHQQGPVTLHRIDRSREQVYDVPGSDQQVIGPTAAEAARQYESSLLTQGIGESIRGGRRYGVPGAGGFSVRLRGDFQPGDEGIDAFRDHLSDAARADYDARAAQFDESLARGLTQRGNRFGSLDEFDQFVETLPGYGNIIGAHARSRARSLLERMDPRLAQQLQMDDAVNRANDIAFQQWAAQRNLSPQAQRDPTLKEQWMADPRTIKYQADPVTGQPVVMQPTPEQQLAMDREDEERDFRYNQDLQQRRADEEFDRIRGGMDQYNQSRARLGQPAQELLRRPDGSASFVDIPPSEFANMGSGLMWGRMNDNQRMNAIVEIMKLEAPGDGTDEDAEVQNRREAAALRSIYGLHGDLEGMIGAQPSPGAQRTGDPTARQYEVEESPEPTSENIRAAQTLLERFADRPASALRPHEQAALDWSRQVLENAAKAGEE